LGGAIYNSGAGSFLTATNSQISRNNAPNGGSGAGIMNRDGAMLILIDSSLSGNAAMGDGGGLSNSNNGSVTLTRVRLAGNSAGECGGGLSNVAGVVTLIDSEVTSGNSAAQYGGGLCNILGTMSVTAGTVIEFNESGYDGGGIANGGVMTIRQSMVRYNEASNGADGIGGGLYAAANSDTTITQSAFVGNTAPVSGGGMAIEGTLRMFNTTVSGNTAFSGGGVRVLSGANLTALNVTIADNNATQILGVGLLQSGGEIHLGNSLLDNHGSNCSQSGGAFNSLGHNLTNDASCFPTASDLTNVDPLLLELANGAHTFQAGSPAIDAADSYLCAETAVGNVDQLGQARPKFNGCDIGAVEWQGFDLYLPIIIR
jgi:hypothetical protein